MTEMEQFWQGFWRILSTPIIHVGEATITILSVVIALMVFLFALYLAKLVEKMVGRALSRRRIDRGIQGSLQRVSRYLIVIVGALAALDTMGISVRSLAAIGAVLMVGIGFGLQNLTQNFVSGIILLMERPIKTGDIIKVGSDMGRVLDIRVRSTIVLTRDDVALIVPNSQLVSEVVTNESHTEDRIRIHMRVGVAYGSDTAKVKDHLLKIAASHDAVLKTPAPEVIFENFGDSALEFDLRVWISDLWGSEQILSHLRFAVDQDFRKADIVIAFPQIDIHIKKV